MFTRVVTHYRALWDTKGKKGRIAVRFHGGNIQTIKIDNYPEYVATLAMLQGEKTAVPEPLMVDTAP